MITTRRRGSLTALVWAGVLVVTSGCTATVAGHGTFAAAGDGSDGDGGQPAGAEVSRSADAPGSRVCSSFDDDQLLDLFGGSVSVSVPYNGLSCEFTATGTTDYIDLTLRLEENATYTMLDGAEPITIGGHPGLEDVVTISVSLGDDINRAGCLQGDNFFSLETTDQGRDITEALVETVLGDFADRR